jgi:hypothetical protein
MKNVQENSLATTVVFVSALAHLYFLIEIDVVAVI